MQWQNFFVHSSILQQREIWTVISPAPGKTKCFTNASFIIANMYNTCLGTYVQSLMPTLLPVNLLLLFVMQLCDSYKEAAEDR